MSEEKPWLKFYGDIPHTLDYPQVSLYEALMNTISKYPEAVAYDCLGYESTYAQFARDIDQCASALAALGVKKGDRMTIAMPTLPQGVVCFYALNKLGAVASMIHPLSPPKEIKFYLNESESTWAMTLDPFYGNFKEIIAETPVKKLVLAQITDILGGIKKLLFKLVKGRKIPKVPEDPMVVWWKDLMASQYAPAPKADVDTNDMAVILYSGGTTGTPKGIMLSNQNFIAEGTQVAQWGGMDSSDSMLAILPIFHGFGLGVCVNAAFMGGGKSILVPTFTPASVAKLVKKKRPSFLVGVPTLFEALNQNPVFQKADLNCLKGAFCGADTLPRPVKERFEEIVRRSGGSVKLREGYGLTEAVTAIAAMPLTEYREGSIGIPFPDMAMKIVDPETNEEKPRDEEGEICIHGPAVMLGYLNKPEETAAVLREHADGKTWLHTGDIASMDADGFFYFKLRLKRMIKSSGFNVYPTQVEKVLYAHPAVQDACVIGVPDKKQVERVKAFVVLKDATKAGPAMEKELVDWCKKDLIKWKCPREVEFRDDLPKTLVGKVAYTELEKEEVARLEAAGEYTGR